MKKTKRRQFLSMLGLSGLTIGANTLTSKTAHAHHTDTHFEEKPAHQLVYQLNKANHDYIESVLYSCGEMLRKYGDDIELVVSAFGPGIHLMAKNPGRQVSAIHQQRRQSLMEYGVRFQVCGNTMKGLNWTEEDIVEGAQIVPVGIDAIMQLQEQGFSYISI